MSALVARLKREEGFVPHAYRDTLGYLTIGFGTLIDERKGGGITRDEAELLLLNRVRQKMVELDTNLEWWRELDEPRQRVLLEMAFQLGIAGLLSFRYTLKAVRERRFEDASRLMLNSVWARQQTPTRAKELSVAMRTGEEPRDA